jgi:broad specificity phosphatase PhoE
MTHEDMLAYHNKKTGQNIPFTTENIRRIYKEHGGENIEVFTNRIIPAYETLLEKYKGKKVLIVAHA